MIPENVLDPAHWDIRVPIHPRTAPWLLEIEAQYVLALSLPGLSLKLDPTKAENLIERYKDVALSEGAEGLIICPKPSVLQREHEAFSRAFLKTEFTNPVALHSHVSRDPGRVLMALRTAAAFSRLERETPGDYLVLPAQFGARHAGTCAAEVMHKVAGTEREFCLDLDTVGYVALIHWPEIIEESSLRIECAGTWYAASNDGRHADVTRVDVAHGMMVEDWNWGVRARSLHASATAWLPPWIAPL